MPDDTSLFQTADLARFLGMKAQSIRKWRLTGKGPAYVRLGGPGGRVAYRRCDVDAWMAQHRFTSTAAETVANTRTAAGSREPAESA